MEHVSVGDWITIDNDMWADHNKKFLVLSVRGRDNSTGVALILEDVDSNIFTRTVPSNQIIKV